MLQRIELVPNRYMYEYIRPEVATIHESYGTDGRYVTFAGFIALTKWEVWVIALKIPIRFFYLAQIHYIKTVDSYGYSCQYLLRPPLKNQK